MYKAIVLDLDGTTLTEFNTVNDTLTDYVAELRQSGMLVFIATGRTLKEARDVLPPRFKVDGIVTANGMSAFLGEKQISQHALPPELVQKLALKAGEWGIYYEIHPNEGPRTALEKDQAFMTEIATEPKPEAVHENEWLSRQEAVQSKIRWTSELHAENAAKIYFFSRDKAVMDGWKAELEQVKTDIAFTTASSTHHNVEVTVEGVSKATGVKKLLDRFYLNREEILAVGDGENDLPLFELAGYCVAMKNATDFVKQQADEVTEFSYKEDGLYRFLKKKLI
ncbi:HAD family hydrolase [Domibacillus sp. DTU_2020_1001157_1_SI_ALB_TIR_016]|uniref:HAD family hydrolase n=1 Tax=Domibacillus sp. DTU_2020_1001157_1_SI_ALB_TIR_016 TaxID=3077789 RepID=UPI0028EC33E5|nr:HAD family hydrolase [Domibacillus sp. DTU_2020_1001157_1_SI_ALB_TIR_016]WNS80652.1 HAD family hydrolase [Domibacillus sp. DTU_2020_1001157_1_SI_ALB_TIR_016]